MLKYKYLYKEYLLRVLVLTFILLLMMFLQLGFTKRTDSLNESYISMVPDIFTSIEFIICIFLFDNFRRSKMEIIRDENIFLSHAERLIITIIMGSLIRLLASTIYSVIVYQNFNNYEFILRILLCDICNIILCYIIFNLFKNKYVSLIISLIISISLYYPKWLYYDIIRINEDKFSAISFIPFVSLGVLIILFIISIVWRSEYVRD